MSRCGYTGDMASYLHWLSGHGSADYQETSVSWGAARSMGAVDAEVAGFAANASDCGVAIGRASGSSAASWVIQCRSTNAADDVYREGVLGFGTPGGQTENSQLIVGVATGLGSDAWILQLASPAPGIYIAWWQDGNFDVLFLATGVDGATGHQMALFIDQRIQ
jgi:hypothetical protein